MRRRQGFTLIEMLVSMTLTIFLMVIMSEAFVAGLDTFRQLKAVGDMEGSLRTAATILRRDLAADHFEGKRRLSDPQFWTQGPPREGFFRIYNGSTATITAGSAYFDEGTDADGIHSYRATDHALHFTVKLRGNQRQNFFFANVADPNSPLFHFGQPDSRFQGTNAYNSAWAEVAYFVSPTGATANATPLYALYRRQRLAVPGSDDLNWGPLSVSAAQAANYQQVSIAPTSPNPGRLYFNSPTDLTVPARRFGGAASSYFPIGTGDDLLLTNVVSFEVKVLFGGAGPNLSGTGNLSTTSAFVSLFDNTVKPYYNNNPQYTGANKPRIFDTWTSIEDDSDKTNYTNWNTSGKATSVPIPIRTNPVSILAISMTLRVWDLKTEQTRQITILQDM